MVSWTTYFESFCQSVPSSHLGNVRFMYRAPNSGLSGEASHSRLAEFHGMGSVHHHSIYDYDMFT